MAVQASKPYQAMQKDGLVNEQELVECMGQWHGCPLDPKEAEKGWCGLIIDASWTAKAETSDDKVV